MTAEEILAIPISSPFRVFSRDKDERKEQFKKFAKQWHPDRGGDAKVFAHLNALHQAAEAGLEKNVIVFKEKGVKGKSYRLSARRLHRFELGTVAVCDRHVAYIIEQKHEALVLHGLKQIGSLRYPDEKIKAAHEKYIPYVEKVIDTDTQQIMLLRKTADVVLLRDLKEYFKGNIEPAHVAWMVSSLLSMACFYEVCGISHNGLTLDNVFVSPENHAAFPLGGWWYSNVLGKPIKYLPNDIHRLMPRRILDAKVADIRFDLEAIRNLANECLGDKADKMHASLAYWLKYPAPKKALDDYKAWQKILTDTFGKRRFLKMSVTPSDIYKE